MFSVRALDTSPVDDRIPTSHHDSAPADLSELSLEIFIYDYIGTLRGKHRRRYPGVFEVSKQASNEVYIVSNSSETL